MNHESSMLKEDIKLQLEGEMTIYKSIEFKEKIVEALSRGKYIEFNLAHITDIDTAGLQLLIMAKEEAKKINIPVSIVECSAAVSDVFELCNLKYVFSNNT